MDHEELINLMVKITNRREKTVYHFTENADKCNHRDRGIEGWFQAELIAELWKKWKGKPIEHPGDGPDLKFPDGEEIELRITTSFNPGYTIDGMIRGKDDLAPVLFFSGYLPYYKKMGDTKIIFENENAVKQWFQDEIPKNNRDKLLTEKSHKTGFNRFNIKYKTVDLVKDKKVIVGIIESSKEISCKKI